MGTLPVEIWQQILASIPIDNEGSGTLVRLTFVNKAMLALIHVPTMWRPFYEKRYGHARPIRETERRNRTGEDWCKIYFERRRQDSSMCRNLRNLVVQYPQLNAQALNSGSEIANLGLDVWDALVAFVADDFPGLDIAEEQMKNTTGPLRCWPPKTIARLLERQFLSIIAARDAIDRWNLVKDYIHDPDPIKREVPFEEAFAGLSSFHGILVDDVCISLIYCSLLYSYSNY